MGRNIAARRKLAELYERGEELRFGPNGPRRGPLNEATGKHEPFEAAPGDDEVAVWVGPPSPQQRDQALRDAQAARARAVLAARRDDDSVEHLTALSFLSEMSDETLIEYVLMTKDDERRQDAEREVLAQEEWANITELQDSWRHYAEEPPEDPEHDREYQALLERDNEYGRQVAERRDQMRDGDRQAMEMLPRETIEKRAMEHRSELIATQAFMKEYERQMAYYSVREIDDHRALFFESPRDMESHPREVLEAIEGVLTEYLNATSAKNAPRAESGSTPSDPPVSPETSESSTHATLSA